jgi:putative transposase
MSSDKEEDQMPRKRHKPEEVVAKLRQVDVLSSQGRSMAEAIRAIGGKEGHYPGSGVRRAEERSRQAERNLEAENARLRRVVSDLTLDKMILAKAAPGRLARLDTDLDLTGRIWSSLLTALPRKSESHARLPLA